MTMRSNFERGRATSARSLPISASQVKSRPGAMYLGGTPQLADRAMDRHGAHAVLQFGEVGVDIVGRHIRRSRFVWLEQAAPVEKIQKAAVVPSVIVARDRLEMAGRTSSV